MPRSSTTSTRMCPPMRSWLLLLGAVICSVSGAAKTPPSRDRTLAAIEAGVAPRARPQVSSQYIATDIGPPRPQTSTTAAAQGACGEALSLLRFGSATSVSRIVSWRGQRVGQSFMSAEAAERRAMLLQHLDSVYLFAVPRGALSPQGRPARARRRVQRRGGEQRGRAARWRLAARQAERPSDRRLASLRP